MENLSGWPDLCRSVRAELDDLAQELASVQPLLDKLAICHPDAVEIRAAAATLHAYYNGVERMLVLIAKYDGERLPTTHSWHRDLLIQMSRPTTNRSFVLSEALRDNLSEYLAFRHFFRHSYPMRLSWPLLQPLVQRLSIVHQRFVREIELFLEHLNPPS